MPDLTRWWILIISIIVGALSGVVGYISWLVALSDFKWWPWAGIGWSSGDTIPLGAGRTLRVVDVRDDEADQPPVLIVEDIAG